MPVSVRCWLAPLALSALAAHAGAHAAGPAAGRDTTPLPGIDSSTALPRIDSSTSLLVVAPHPDDETLCCAGAIQRVVGAGGQASVLWLTSGDAARMVLILMSRSLFPGPAVGRELGARRMVEARTATARLGVKAAGQLFLGYPDGGLLELLDGYRTGAYTSGTTGATAVPYADALHPGHPYTGTSLERDFLAVLERVQPNLILAPTPLDAHPDHRAAGLLAQALAPAAARVRYWIVHGGEGWPAPPDLLPGVPLGPAPLAASLEPMPFELSPGEEDRKLFALQAHASQMRLTAAFLLSFVRTNELYSSRAR